MRTFIAIVFLLSHSLTWAQEVHEVTLLEMRYAGKDYAPVAQDSGFVMCSFREGSGMVDYRQAGNNEYLSDLYWVPLRNGRAGEPVLFSANLASPVNEGPAAFTDNGRTIWFTRNLQVPRKLTNMRRGSSPLGLFHSTMVDGAWQDPVAFSFNAPDRSMLHPAFSADGDTLFFASDMVGGLGGTDLYFSLRRPNGWSPPQNMGPKVNSEANELFPVMHKDGRLYFASDRVGGSGKLDIHVLDHGTVERLPEPLNSTENDYGYSPLTDGSSFLFSSDRTGHDRIYVDKPTVERFKDCMAQVRNNRCYAFRGRINSAADKLPLDHVWDLGDGTLQKGRVAEHCYTGPGRYTVRSILVDRVSGDVFMVQRSFVHEVADRMQAIITAPDTVRTGRPFQLDPIASHVPGMEINAYRWDLGDGSSLDGGTVLYSYRKPGTYEIRLDLVGRMGGDKTLSSRCNTKRIVVIDKYQEGTETELVAVYQSVDDASEGFDFQELAFDDLSMGTDDRPEARYSVQLFASKDRISLDDPMFTEVSKFYRVLERFDPVSGLFTYSVGDTENLDELYEVYRKVKELQFMDAEVFMLDMDKLLDMSKLDMAAVEDLNNAKLRSHHIQFGFESADMDSTSNDMLQPVVDLLNKYPELLLVVEAHTDDKGSAQFNMDLSDRRARSVLERLTVQGIDPQRLVPVGHGRNQPIADNRTEEGRTQNRRVEFRLSLPGEDQAFQKTR